MANNLAARFAEAGVKATVEQWRVLVSVYKKDGINQGHLCEVLSQEKTGVSRLVATLEKNGYLVRKSSDEDRRVKLLFITDAGRQLIDETIDIVLETRDEPAAHIDPEDLAVCKRVLWQIIAPTLPANCMKDEEC